MSYQALYRKYRPSTLEDVIGQDVVIKILKNAIITNKIGHAYLFSGPRGIGKTTIAKAVAKTVNCLDLKDGVSCEKCDNCKSINEGFNPDIIEIDAASNNGINEIREIKSKINLVPSVLKYKVYIIDEVHMLSTEAFNALLKTLEEPPEHIIFILATTDVQKVPSTIISRCQCFDFHRISVKDIVERLKYIAKCEKIDVAEEVLSRIAFLSDGGLRDSIGMLDKLTSYSNKKINIDDFEKINGIVSIDRKNEFIDYIYKNDVKNMIDFIDDIYNCGKDLIIFVQDLLKLCKDRAIEYYVDNSSEDIDFLIDFSNMLNSILKNVKETADVKTLLEINLLDFISKKSGKISVSTEKTEDKVKKMEKESEKIEKKSEKTEEKKLIDNNSIIITNCLSKATKKEKQDFESKFKSISDYTLDSKLGATASFIIDGKICAVSENEVIISFSYESMVDRGINLINIVQNLLEKVYNKKYDVAFVTSEEWEHIKKKFIEDKGKGISYEYIPLEAGNKEISKEIKEKKEDTLIDQAVTLFGDDVVSI